MHGGRGAVASGSWCSGTPAHHWPESRCEKNYLIKMNEEAISLLFGLIFAVFGVIYRYSVWLRRPSTAMLNRRGWDAFRERKGRGGAQAERRHLVAGSISAMTPARAGDPRARRAIGESM